MIDPPHEEKAWMAGAGLIGVITGAALPEHVLPMAAMWGFMLLGNLVLGYIRRDKVR